MREVHVAVAVVRRGGRVLIARRPDGVHQGGLLEFPGGKVEAGETVQQALVRELAEETGLRVDPASLQPLIGIRHDYGDKRVFLDVWQTDTAEGEAEGREGQPVSWLAPAQLQDEEFPAANRAIIRALRLPSVYAVTGAFENPGQGLALLESGLARSRPELVVLRAPWLEGQAYRDLARAALAMCRRQGAGLMWHGPAAGTPEPGFAGWHLTWAQAARMQQRPIDRHQWLAVSCHNTEQIRHARSLEADFITLGPVRPTPSHPGAPTLGWSEFSALAATATMPVYALGGMDKSHLETSCSSGGQGIAGIGHWWQP